MSWTSTARPACRALLLALALAILPAAADAQTGRITGRVVDDAQSPVQGAQVSVLGTRLGTLTNASGQFVLTGVPAGTQQVRVQYTGYSVATVPVTVAAGQAASVEVTLQGEAIQLGGITVSASRRAERVTEAPAAVTVIDASVIDNTVGNSYAAALKEVPGLDFVQVGMTSVAINARGFNSSFNNRMLMTEDGRVAVLPENGLPVGQLTAVPKIDLAGMEVLIGPGAALYGADASNGVLALTSKDPAQFQGTTVELSAGNRAYMDVQARHAGVNGKFGYKVAGEFQRADDWDSYLTYNTAAGAKSESEVLDFQTEVARGTGALVYYGDMGRFELSAGASQSDGVGQTNVGRNQLSDWGYNFLQAQFGNENWYFNLYRTQSTSGESYAVNRYLPYRYAAANAGKSDEEIRLMSDWPSDGRMYAAEFQNSFRVAPLLQTEVTWGAQARRDVVSSDRQWLKDALTGEDLTINQYGVYGQAETPLASWLDVVVAARYDDHDKYDAQFSPKAGLVFKPAADQALRVTYNRAFKSPTTLQTSFHIYDFTAIPVGGNALGIGVFGNAEGFLIRDAKGVETRVDPLVPEENTTWEIGYKGVLGNRLWVDATAYQSRYENFLTPLQFLGNPLQGAATYFPDGTLIKTNAGDFYPQWVLTYRNAGKAELRGIDTGLRYLLTDKLSVDGAVSYARLRNEEEVLSFGEATAFNAPELKWNLGVDVKDMAGFNGGATVRHVDQYHFLSGINRGVVPGFTTLDVNVGYRVPAFGQPLLSVGVANLFTCSQDDEVALAYDAKDTFKRNAQNLSSACGFGLKHQEMVNMPAIGTMVFLGLRYHVN